MAFKSKYGVDDLVMLTTMSEDKINEVLKKRFDNDVIYTYIGNVLISVNPFRMIKNMYTEKTLTSYRGKFPYELPPHVYALADNMYRQMLQLAENQCVIISGESGAGKTEASKFILQYIATVSGNREDVQRVKNVILESNPLLESFGNAKTIRNNNSSRFGKYMEIEFDRSGDPRGGRITNYLLEKSRIVYQAQGERSFHIFYQLLKCADPQLQSELCLAGPEAFNYVNQSGCVDVDGIDDGKWWSEVQHSMDVMGITPALKKEVFTLLAIVLHLGNIDFKGQDKARVSDRTPVETLAYLLGCTFDDVEKALIFKTIQTGQGERAELFQCPQNPDGAYFSRDALAKALYSRLFDWIVNQVNKAMVRGDPDAIILSVLDIYGFEIFEWNSFEQLCINYVNEKLQQIFIDLTLKSEQEEYEKEGVPWKQITYFNNKICCDLIEVKSKQFIGIFALLDDTCNFPKGTDEKFLAKMEEALASHAHFQSRGANRAFTIKHYAGEVTYNIDGCVEKNRDQLYQDLIELIQKCQLQLIPILFPEKVSLENKKKPTTASYKIKQSIQQLVDAIRTCTPHYIRTIKPNAKKRPSDFDSHLVLHQVKYLGLLENVRVRRAGYAYRQIYEKFFYRFRVCCNKTWPTWNGEERAGVEEIINVLNLPDEEFNYGHTRMFLRHPETVFQLEELRERKVYAYACRLQRFFQKYAMADYYRSIHENSVSVFMNKKMRRRNSITREYHGDYLDTRMNLELRKIVGSDKIHYAAMVRKYDKKGKWEPRQFLMTSTEVVLMNVEKNKSKDKLERAKKPWLYEEKRRFRFNDIEYIQMTPYADNFVAIGIRQEHGFMIWDRRKSEMVATLRYYCKTVDIRFQEEITYLLMPIKKNLWLKATGLIDGRGPDGGVVEGKKSPFKLVSAEGLPASTQPYAGPSGTKQAFKQSTVKDTRSAKDIIMRRGAPVAGGSSGGSDGGYNPPAAAASPAPGGGGRGRTPPPPPGGARAPPPRPKKNLWKALYPYNASDPSELSLKEGEILELLEPEDSDGWAKGKTSNGKEGYYPAAYAEKYEEPEPEPEPEPVRRPAPAPAPAPTPTPQPARAQPQQAARPTGGAAGGPDLGAIAAGRGRGRGRGGPSSPQAQPSSPQPHPVRSTPQPQPQPARPTPQPQPQPARPTPQPQPQPARPTPQLQPLALRPQPGPKPTPGPKPGPPPGHSAIPPPAPGGAQPARPVPQPGGRASPPSGRGAGPGPSGPSRGPPQPQAASRGPPSPHPQASRGPPSPQPQASRGPPQPQASRGPPAASGARSGPYVRGAPGGGARGPPAASGGPAQPHRGAPAQRGAVRGGPQPGAGRSRGPPATRGPPARGGYQPQGAHAILAQRRAPSDDEEEEDGAWDDY